MKSITNEAITNAKNFNEVHKLMAEISDKTKIMFDLIAEDKKTTGVPAVYGLSFMASPVGLLGLNSNESPSDFAKGVLSSAMHMLKIAVEFEHQLKEEELTDEQREKIQAESLLCVKYISTVGQFLRYMAEVNDCFCSTLEQYTGKPYLEILESEKDFKSFTAIPFAEALNKLISSKEVEKQEKGK